MKIAPIIAVIPSWVFYFGWGCCLLALYLEMSVLIEIYREYKERRRQRNKCHSEINQPPSNPLLVGRESCKQRGRLRRRLSYPCVWLLIFVGGFFVNLGEKLFRWAVKVNVNSAGALLVVKFPSVFECIFHKRAMPKATNESQ